MQCVKSYKNTKFNKLNTKANNVEKEILDVSNLIQTNQYITDKQRLQKKTGDVDTEIPGDSGSVTTTVLNTKIGKLRTKCQMVVAYWLQLFLIQKLEKLRTKYLLLVIQSRKHIMTLKYDTEAKCFTMSD